MPQCAKILSTGVQCKNIAVQGGIYCWVHSKTHKVSKAVWKSDESFWKSDESFSKTVKPKIKKPRPTPKKKPVIYLYPEQILDVDVSLDVKGELTTTYPKYLDGWRVTAYPNGDLIFQNQKYYCLYWESIGDYQYDLSTGFVVNQNDLVQFLETTLSRLGLNYRERQEFIVYWLPELEKSRFNLIHFATTEYVKNAVLTIKPEPDTLIRVFMVAKPLNEPIKIVDQTLPPTPERSGFTVVEWGGSII